MSSSLSKHVDNLSEGLHNNKCVDCESCLDYIRTKNEKLILKCFKCKQYYEKDFNKELIKRFASTYEFCNKNLNKFILLLRKGVYPYEYMDNWERFNETSLPRDIKLVTTDKKTNKLVSEPNYHTINYISENLSIIEMNKTKVKMKKPIYLGLSILEISKILVYELWYDYMKPKYNDNVKLCYMDTNSFVMNIKTEDFYKDIANDVEKRFDMSNYEVDRPLSTGKNKKVTGLMNDKLGGKIITEFVTLRPKTYWYLTDDCKEDKKAKATKKMRNKRMIKFNDYKNCLLKDEVILKSQQIYKQKTRRIHRKY